MGSISRRSPLVSVEYDGPRGSRIVSKPFSDPSKARRLYVSKLKAGKNPKVVKPVEDKPS